jgi:hypothetical protein
MILLPRKAAKVSAKVTGAGAQARRARGVAAIVDDDLAKSVRNVGDDAELIYQAHALRRSGRLARGIKARATGDTVIVSAVAVDPDSGFDYVRVTRFGHKKAIIRPVGAGGRPRRARTVARSSAGQFSRRGAPALVFESLGQVWKLPYVRGFRPTSDWVADALPEVEAAAATEMEQTGNRIAVRWAK